MVFGPSLFKSKSCVSFLRCLYYALPSFRMFFLSILFYLVAVPCPESNPWAIANGTICCERFHHTNDYHLALNWHDPASFCFGGNFISCPSALCLTSKTFMGKLDLACFFFDGIRISKYIYCQNFHASHFRC